MTTIRVFLKPDVPFLEARCVPHMRHAVLSAIANRLLREYGDTLDWYTEAAG